MIVQQRKKEVNKKM